MTVTDQPNGRRTRCDACYSTEWSTTSDHSCGVSHVTHSRKFDSPSLTLQNIQSIFSQTLSSNLILQCIDGTFCKNRTTNGKPSKLRPKTKGFQEYSMSFWCPKPQGSTSDIYSKRSALTQVISVKDVNWETIQKRLETYPHEATERDKFGVTVLHHLIRKHAKNYTHENTCNDNVPTELFRLLINEYPCSLDLLDKMTGCSALHMACASPYGHKMKDIILLILEKRREAAMQLSEDGRLPLHQCTDAHVGKMLLEIYPKGVSSEITCTVFDFRSQT